jgi:hypothetical protein
LILSVFPMFHFPVYIVNQITLQITHLLKKRKREK